MNTDLKLAFRNLRRSPGFAAVAIVTLALGIGANATVFSVLDTLLLRSLPVADPDRVFFIEGRGRGGSFPSHSFLDYLDYKTGAKTFSDIAAYRIAPLNLQFGSGAERAWGYLATGNYFQLLGVRPALGRFFTPAEDAVRGGSPYAVLSFDSWQRRFAGDPDVVGTTVRINGLPYTILGVAPRGFNGTEVVFRPDLWVPMSMQAQIEGWSWLDRRSTLNAWVVGRLASGVSADQATAELNAIAASIAAANPRSHEGLQVALARPGFVGSTGRRPFAAFMAGVMALAGLVLLAACANLASLLSSRIVDRFREIAIRLAVGATRARIARQLIIETTVIATCGGAAGFALAATVLRALTVWQLPLPLPVQLEVTPDLPVFAFGAGVTLLVAIFSCIAPAHQAWRTPFARLTGPLATDRVVRRWSTRDLLLAGQIAVCALLVTACALSLKNLRNALTLPLGFELSGVSTVGFDLAAAGYSREEGLQFQRRALERVTAIPGVTAVAYASSLPLTIDQSSTDAFPEDGEIRASRGVNARLYQVSPGYFDVVRTRLILGRDFTVDDSVDRPAVAIVNQAFVRRVMGSADPIGRRFRASATQFVQVVGVVEDGKYENLSEVPQAAVFRPVTQSYNSTSVIVARSSLPERDIARQMAGAITDLDPRVTLQSQQSGNDAIAIAFLPAQAAGVALTAFGVLALVLPLVGIYGLASYSVSARVREIGIRVAIGARRRHLVRFVLGRTVILLAAGSLVGLLASLAAAQLMGAVMYHASTREPAVLIATVASMALVGLFASWMPLRRALAIDPVRTLREG